MPTIHSTIPLVIKHYIHFMHPVVLWLFLIVMTAVAMETSKSSLAACDVLPSHVFVIGRYVILPALPTKLVLKPVFFKTGFLIFLIAKWLHRYSNEIREFDDLFLLSQVLGALYRNCTSSHDFAIIFCNLWHEYFPLKYGSGCNLLYNACLNEQTCCFILSLCSSVHNKLPTLHIDVTSPPPCNDNQSKSIAW